MRCLGDVFDKLLTSMFLMMFFKTQNIVQTMHLTMDMMRIIVLNSDSDNNLKKKREKNTKEKVLKEKRKEQIYFFPFFCGIF